MQVAHDEDGRRASGKGQQRVDDLLSKTGKKIDNDKDEGRPVRPDAAIDALDTAGKNNGGGDARNTGRQEDSGATLVASTKPRLAGAAMTMAIRK